MKRRVFRFSLCLLLSGLAGASPLLGSQQSFDQTAYCHTADCGLMGHHPVTKTLIEDRYVADYHRRGTDGRSMYGTLYSVYRQGKKVVSIGVETHAQDDLFWPLTPDNPDGGMSRFTQQLVAMATGVTPTVDTLVAFGHRCQSQRAALLPLGSGARRYVLSCSVSAEADEAATIDLRVFLDTP